MHIIFNLFLGAAVASSTPALPNDELGRALTNLKGKVAVTDHSRVQRLQDAGAWLSLHAIYLAGVVAIGSVVPANVTDAPNAPAEVLEAAREARATMARGQRLLMRGAVIAVNVGGIMWLISFVGKKLRPRPRPEALGRYETPQGVDEFFRLDLAEQYAVARPNAEFTRFLIELSDAHDVVARRDPAHGRARATGVNL